MGVFAKVPRAEVDSDRESIVVGSRWVVTNKGTLQHPRIKARLVAQEFATADGKGELFAGTPGLCPLRCVVSNLATDNKDGAKKLMIMDVKSAFLYGAARRKIHIRLPPEAQVGDATVMLGRLNKAMYGTRDAPQIWHEHLCQTLESLGFVASKLNPGVYVHREMCVELVVHVDDLAAVGAIDSLESLYRKLSKVYEVKREILGEGYLSEVKYLGRTIRWTTQGIEWEHDPKHSDLLMKEYGMERCKTLSTPVCSEDFSKEGVVDTREPMDDAEARRFRASAARLNYLAQDRPDLAVASCLVARSMSNPKRGDEVKLKRAIRYLRQHPVVNILYPWQERNDELTLLTDSDWASCKTSRRSCSGGVIMRGQHLISFWCKLQHKICLSSGEAELYSANKGLSEYMGVLHLYREMLDESWGTLRHLVDASACKAILLRKGVGSLKHLEIRDLWGQEITKRLGISVEKISRDVNAADALASPCDRKDLLKHMYRIGVQLEGGRCAVKQDYVSAVYSSSDGSRGPTSGCLTSWPRGGVCTAAEVSPHGLLEQPFGFESLL